MITQGLKNSLNKIREISTDIYHQYVPIIDDDTDIANFAQPILTVPEVYNEFCNALINRIVYTQIYTKVFNNPLRKLEGNVMPLGYAGQEIYVNPAKGRRYNPNDFAGILQKYEADVKVQYLIKNMDLQYPLTVIRTKLKEAFVSWENLDSFISGLTQSLYNGAYIDMFRYTKALVSSAYASNNAPIEIVNAITTKKLAEEFVVKARTLFLNFQMPSTEYNAWHKVGGAGRPITTWSNPEDIILILRNDVSSFIDVNVLAQSFHISETTLLGNIYHVDNFDVWSDGDEKTPATKIFDGSAIIGMIADRNWFKIKPIDEFMENGYNANNRAMQYFLNIIKMYEYSLFANCKIFATKAPEITIKGLDYQTNEVSVAVGDTEGLEITTTPVTANSPKITYTSSDEEIFVIDETDDNKIVKITGLKEGTATLTATSGSINTTLTINVTTS